MAAVDTASDMMSFVVDSWSPAVDRLLTVVGKLFDNLVRPRGIPFVLRVVHQLGSLGYLEWYRMLAVEPMTSQLPWSGKL